MRTRFLQHVVRRYRFWALTALIGWGSCACADETDRSVRSRTASPAQIVGVPKAASGADPARLDRQLSQMEEQLRTRPSPYAPASRYRARCATYGQHDRSITFFKDLLAERSGDNRVRIELAAAYVDKIPTCKGLTAFIRRGNLARKSLDQLDPVIANDRDSWLAYYCRGMNHLHWPRVLGHTADAVADFKRCIELQQPDTPGNTKPYYSRGYIGLGDAHTKAKQYDQARKVWREGLKRFPQSTELKGRLAVRSDSALLEYVGAKRSLDNPVDTDFSFLDSDADTASSQ